MSALNFSSFENLVNLFTSIKQAIDNAVGKMVSPLLLKDTVGWVGKNLLPITLNLLKTNNTNGTWSGNTYTLNGLTWTITTNNDGYVTKISVNGTSSDRCVFSLFKPSNNFKPNAGSYLTSKGNSNTDIPLRQDAYNGTTWVKTLGSVTNDSDVATTIDYNGYDRYSSYIDIASGKTVSNENVYLMLRKADILDSTYEPYHSSVEQTLRDAEVIEGKNLLHIDDSVVSQTIAGVTFTVNRNTDGEVTSIIANGTATQTTFFALQKPISSKVGTAGLVKLNGCVGGSDTTYEMSVHTIDSGAARVYYNGKAIIAVNEDEEIDFAKLTVNNQPISYENTQIIIRIGSGQVCNNLEFKPMIRNASESDPTFEPYYIPLKDSKFDRAEQRVLGAKNLIPYPYANNSQEVSGITYTINSDGSITLSGTATADSSVTLVNQTRAGFRDLLLANDVILSGGISNSVKMSMWNYDGNNHSLASTGADTLIHFTNQSANFNIAVAVANGTVLTTPVTIKPMLRLASDPDDTYVPYAMTNRELTEAVFLKRALVAGDDLDDITEYGAYGIVTGVLNTPENVSYASMIVLPIAAFNTNARSQMVYTNSNIYIRHKTGSPAAWTSWFKFTGNALV